MMSESPAGSRRSCSNIEVKVQSPPQVVQDACAVACLIGVSL